MTEIDATGGVKLHPSWQLIFGLMAPPLTLTIPWTFRTFFQYSFELLLPASVQNLLIQGLPAALPAADVGGQAARGHDLLGPRRVPPRGHLPHAEGPGRGPEVPLLRRARGIQRQQVKVAAFRAVPKDI